MKKEIKKTFLCLKRYPSLSIAILFFLVFGCAFDGFSLGMLIPLLQSMISPQGNPFAGLPLINKFQSLFTGLSQKEIISYLFILIFLIIFIKNVFLFIGNVFISKLRFLLTKSLQIDLFNRLLGYGVKFFDSAKTGHLVNNIYNESTRIGNFMFAILNLSAVILKIAVYATVLFIISWKFSLVSLLLVAFIFPPIHYIVEKNTRISRMASVALSGFNVTLLETLNGIRVVKSFRTEKYEKDRFRRVADELFRVNYKGRRLISFIQPFSEVVILGLIIATFLILIRVTNLDITKLLPLILTYLFILLKTLTQINAFNNLRSEAASHIGAFEPYDKLMDKVGKPIIHSGNKQLDEFKHSIEFKEASFGYHDNNIVFKDINLRIPRGKITALVGASGAGKSTLVNLIMRFYEPWEGVISVDGVDLKEFSLNSWRNKIGIVSQGVFIFNTTAKENIIYGHFEISDAEIIAAARAANAHEFIISLPDGYDTVLGERGVKLSGGEKQRISIARAIIHNPEILILDEATSSLDTRTEQLIREAIDRLTQNRTVIAIAHRLSTIKHADNIIVLEKGKIVEQGNHEDLLNEKGFYKNFYELQYGKVERVIS